MTKFPPYDPGLIPERPPPKAGESIRIEVAGLPPYKDYHFSIRNPKHKRYHVFVALRKAASEAMRGHAWYSDAIRFDLRMEAPELERGKSVSDYLSGIADTLDGSHGPNFTYLPIVYEDDCQVVDAKCVFKIGETARYVLDITFLPTSDSG